MASVFLVAQVLVVPPALPLGWDEVVYVSQVSDQAPPAYLSPPRARGLITLIAPVAAQTAGIEVLRWYLAILSSLALLGAYGLWLRVRNSYAVPLAALLFAGLWTTIFYGPAVMPNLWLAYAAVAATALAVLAVRVPNRPVYLAGLAVVMAGAALVRPSDTAMLAVGLGLAVLWRVRRRVRRAILPLAAIGLGTAAGLAQWVAEAYLNYGGLLSRLRGSSARNGGEFGLHIEGDLRSVNGPLGCGRMCQSGVSEVEAGLWAALALGVVLAFVVARRTHERTGTLLPIVAASPIAFLYFFYIPNSAPRFLLPGYALLALTCAFVAISLPRLFTGRARTPARVVVAIGVAVYLLVQQVVLGNIMERVVGNRTWLASVAADLRELGVRPPCLVSGDSAVAISYDVGCSARYPAAPESTEVPAYLLEALDDGRTVAVVAVSKPGPEVYVQDWDEHVLESPDGRDRMYVYFPPPAQP